MATDIHDQEELATATLWGRIKSWSTGRAELLKQVLQTSQEARSASTAAREAAERAAETAREVETAIRALAVVARPVEEEPQSVAERELGKLLVVYLQQGRWKNISISKMLGDLDNEAGELVQGTLLAVDTILSAEREEKDAITAGPQKVFEDWQERGRGLSRSPVASAPRASRTTSPI